MSGGIFELWLIAGEEYDVEKFMQLIDGFDNKVFDKNSNQNVSSSQGMEYLRSTDHQFDVLLFRCNRSHGYSDTSDNGAIP